MHSGALTNFALTYLLEAAKGFCHAVSEASQCPPDKNTAQPPNAPPQRPRNTPAERAQGRFANRLYFAALRATG